MGELRVTVGEAAGVGGRNQEFALAAAECVAGCEDIIIGAVDSEGTDGPGGAQHDGRPLPNLAGALVEGTTQAKAFALGLDLRAALTQHDATPLLHQLESGIVATQSTGLCDLQVILVTARAHGA